jgi:hypothetical protein
MCDCSLNSIEMVTVPWWFLKMSGNEDITAWMASALANLRTF